MRLWGLTLFANVINLFEKRLVSNVGNGDICLRFRIYGLGAEHKLILSELTVEWTTCFYKYYWSHYACSKWTLPWASFVKTESTDSVYRRIKRKFDEAEIVLKKNISLWVESFSLLLVSLSMTVGCLNWNWSPFPQGISLLRLGRFDWFEKWIEGFECGVF